MVSLSHLSHFVTILKLHGTIYYTAIIRLSKKNYDVEFLIIILMLNLVRKTHKKSNQYSSFSPENSMTYILPIDS